ICADIIAAPASGTGVDGTCDVEETAEVNANGSFSTVFPLYRLPGQSITEHFLTATAQDKYGNLTLDSNTVKVSVTTEDPFVEVSIIPAFTGVNNDADY